MARSRITETQVLDGDFLSEEESLTLSGTLQNQIDDKPDTLLELPDTPDAYSRGLYLKSTASGTEWATASGGGGTSYHSELDELDYASAGHTGFSPTIHTHTESDVTDLDKYTQAEVNTISGTLQDYIDAKPDNFLELDDTPSAYDDGKHLKSTTSGIEFTYTSFLDLSDTPTTYSGSSRLPLISKENETGVEFGLIPETAISGTYFVSYEAGRLLRGATGNRPDLVYLGPVAGLAFDAGKTESCYGSFKIPYAWYDNTDIELKINYMNDVAQIGIKTCAWKLAFHAYQEGEFYSDKTLTVIDIDTTLPNDVAVGRYTVETLLLPHDNVNNPLSIGDKVTFQFYRDGAVDDMTGDAILLSLSFELQTGDISQLMG